MATHRSLWVPNLARRRLASGMVLCLLLAACSTNPATGQQQFTALMSPDAENQLGVSEHPKILAQYGGPFPDSALEAYVNSVGQKVAANTERSDVKYKFFVLDTPMVNAFAMPGGYVYVTRGLLGLANSEAELAGVLAHEIGHVTARHSAERYSQGLVAGLGLAVLGAAVDSAGVSRAAGLGSDLMLKSYSRSQEYQADELGVRYLSRAGYDPVAMARFLNTLDANTRHEAGLKSRGGGGDGSVNYFSTHPQTDDRVARARQMAMQYPVGGRIDNAAYLHHISGVTYGDSARSGFMRGQTFIHPELGFGVTFPHGFDVDNQSDKVLATNGNGAGVIFDGAVNRAGLDLPSYLTAWVGGDKLSNAPEAITINGMQAATSAMSGSINGAPATIRVVVIEWSHTQIYRFQIAMPGEGPSVLENDMKRMTYSFHRLTADERAQARTLRIDLVTAQAGDSVDTLARQMNLNDEKDDPMARFRVLNALGANGMVKAGQMYKVVR